MESGSGTGSGSESPLVAIYGSGEAPPEDLERARMLGGGLARAGYGVLNGGYGGTMDAAAAGAYEAGGRAVGVTCAKFTFRPGPSRHCTEIVEAPSLTARLEELLVRASGYVVLPGGNGTLTELSLTWEHLRKGLIPPRPLVVWREPWRAILDPLAEGPYLSGGLEMLTWVDDVDGALLAIRERVPV